MLSDIAMGQINVVLEIPKTNKKKSSSKKSPTSGKNIDYIHDFKKGVKLYCGPTKEDPEVFLCFGGKLTLTERGLVF